MESALNTVLSKIDVRIKNAVVAMLSKNERINEIRIREHSYVYVTVGNDNKRCNVVVNKDMLGKTFEMLCSGTLHTHMDTIKNGYLILPEGIRVGVVGRAVNDNETIKNIFDITALNIRIPYPIYGVSSKIFEKIRSSEYFLNILIYSLPGAGKTTMIRDLAYLLATEGNKRVALIDSRCELSDIRLKNCSNIDIYSAYPKDLAMEFAIRTMNPQYMICDEIGSLSEAQALLVSQSAGVPIIATAHSRNIIELMRRKNISILHENGVFDLYVGLRRNQQDKIMFSFCCYDEVDL